MIKSKLRKKFHHLWIHTWKWVQRNLPLILGGILLFSGGIALWITTLELPPLDSTESITVAESTKIYDRTGKVVLFDINKNFRRTNVPAEEMSPYVRQASIAIEDEDFYSHGGIKITSIIRAVIANALSGEYGQGGSTITQQVIKNALLTREKTITRKIKEWILALKLEKILSKEDILTLYLNSSPYGGNVYGIEEASRVFFGKKAVDLTLVESAYLAALPQAPTYYSPYGSHREALDKRKNLVLTQMNKNGLIDDAEFESAKTAIVTFAPAENSSIKAPHFVMFVREQLTEMFGEETIAEGGLKVITTLDYDLEQKAEDLAEKWANENKTKFNAENLALVSIDPTNGDILTMVGSRDYFDKEIQGNYNIATALRQPGSSFKPIVYAAAFNIGYRPETILYDVPTEFSTNCNTSDESTCYHPHNYDELFRGPMSLRAALSQSINIPAVKLLYLVGIDSAVELATKMGITGLTDTSRFGLSLVLGGGEVKLLDMVGAYGVFAAEGKKHPHRSILSIQNKSGKEIYKAEFVEEEVLPRESALNVTSILADRNARIPLFGSNSVVSFPGRSVALKTGTTNDYRDAWIIGYTPYISVGAWAGNNDNTSMEKKTSGLIVAPFWAEFMNYALSRNEEVAFSSPEPQDPDVKPIIRGDLSGGAHSILHFVSRRDPLGPAPRNPSNDPQYRLWERGVRNWFGSAQPTGTTTDSTTNTPSTPTENLLDDVSILSPYPTNKYPRDTQIPVVLSIPQGAVIDKAEVFVNNTFVGSFNKNPFVFSFVPADIKNIKDKNRIKVRLYGPGNTREDIEKSFELSD